MRHKIISWLAILAIISFLVALVWPWFNRRPKAYIYSGPGEAGPAISIKTALGMYQVDTGRYPKSLQDLVQKPNDEFKWHGPYIISPKVPIDPWGHEYIYEFPGKHNPGSYDLISVGPDGKKGTEDDIGNW